LTIPFFHLNNRLNIIFLSINSYKWAVVHKSPFTPKTITIMIMIKIIILKIVLNIKE